MNKMNLKIKNYKSIGEVNLSINENSNRIVSLIGNNNAGKTKILEAIKKLGESGTFTKNDKRTVFNSNKEVVEINENPSIEMDLLLDEGDSKICINTSIKDDLFKTPNISENTKKEIEKKIDNLFIDLEKTNYKKSGAFHYKKKTFQDDYTYYPFLNAVSQLKNDEIIRITKEIRRLSKLLLFTEKIEVISIEDINIFKFNKLDLNLIFQTNIDSNLKSEELKTIKLWERILKINLEDLILDISKKESRNKYLRITEFSKNANSLIKSLEKDFFNKEDVLDFEFSIILDLQDLSLNINLERKNKENKENWTWNTEITDSGDGIKKMWSIIFILNSINKNEPKIILIDEPEKSLNPVHQNYLAKYLNKLISSDSKHRKNQIIIYATHSPFMIGMEMYQNIYSVDRSEENNSTIIKSIYDVKGRGVPNLLLDKNVQLRFIEAQLMINKPKSVLFVEGISDFFIMKNILKNEVFIVPLFGSEYKKTASFHLPYLLSWTKENIMLLVDDDSLGNEIIEWFKNNSHIPDFNMKKYSDLFSNGETLESSIVEPWFRKNQNIKRGKDKKIDAIIFNKNNKDIKDYNKLIDFAKGNKDDL